MAVVIDGGQRIATVAVEWIARADRLPSILTAAEQAALVAGLDDPDHVLVVRTASRGDFSRYTLHLVAALGSLAPPAAFDPLLVEVDFSFKVECPSDFDCGPECTCLPRRHTSPTIDYLAKDYQGFRRIMLERMALLAPEWTERNPADVGVALVEMLAYVADELSYRQDAVATEAYLDTARSRISLRRLARLVDYRIHEGCNARAWARIQVSSPAVTLPAGTVLLTQVADLPTRLAVGSRDHEAALDARPVVFATVDLTVLHSNLNSLAFYTWGELGCCLPIGATSATLRGRHPDLRVGDVLVLAEVRSPTSMRTDELDPSHRQAVRLVEVTNATDPSGAVVPGGMQNVTEIRWHDDDALTFPLCINVVDGDDDVAQAFGNIVLVDHGELIADEDLGSVPESRLDRVPAGGCDDLGRSVAVPPRYRPLLSRGPLTRAVAQPRVALFDVPLTPALKARLDARQYADPLPAVFSGHGIALPSSGPTVRGRDPLWSVGDADHAFQLRNDLGKLKVFDVSADPAINDTAQSPRTALPAISLHRDLNGVRDDWAPQFDLLGSDRGATEFTVETETDGTVQLRFGDDVHGLRPEPASKFTATYRIGNGVAGNVGRDAIVHIVSNDSAIDGGHESHARRGRGRPGDRRPGTPGRALRVRGPGTRGDGARLRRGDRAERIGAARRRDLPVDRLVAHGVRDRRPVRRAGRRCAVRAPDPRLARALPDGRVRPRGRRSGLRSARGRAAHLCRARLLPRRRRGGGPGRAVRPGTAGREARALPSGQPDVRPAGLPVGRARGGALDRRACSPSTSSPSSDSASPSRAASTAVCSRWADSRSPASTTTATSPSAASSN